MERLFRNAAFAAVALAGSLAQAQTAPEKIDIEAAVQKALAQTPGLAAVRARQDAAEATADSVRGRMLPTIYVQDEQLHYKDPFVPGFFGGSFVIYNNNVNTFVASASQPLLGLLHLTQDHASATNNADAAGEQSKSVESTVREQVQTAYLRYFEAVSAVGVAQTSEAQLAEQHNLAEARLKAGVITNADVLRIETAQANAKLQEVQAQSQADATKDALLVTLGYPPGAAVELVDPVSMVEATPAQPEDTAAQTQAEQNRHEVAAARLQSTGAAHQKNSAFFKLLPEANLEAAYTHIHGEALAPPDASYIGLKASWPIFTWGADWFAYKAAQANAAAAALSADDQARQVRIDASTKLAQLKAAASAVDLAKTAIASAEEAYRVTNAQVKAGVATSTSDLLDAQSALTQAKLSLARAKYERAIAGVALQRATGG
ncbi:MAG: TolC family protein [Deltaproteobacteria bacterium]|nr:TolC family protein [Deltaproteobacteria bacterium]